MTAKKDEALRIRMGVVMRDARVNAGLTQRELADRLGIPRSAIAQIEHGSGRLLVGVFIEIARALNTDVEVLMTEIWPQKTKKKGTRNLLGDAP